MRRLAMTSTIRVSLLASVALLALGFAAPAQAQQANMTFFITSDGPGKGGDLGGLAGADAHCARLATAAGTTGKTWRAYLSTQGANAVNAKDRIGKGPWQNAKGTVVAASVADLHSANNKLNKENSLSEKGEAINGRGDTPNRHDILTGSQADGTAFAAGDDRTCGNWTQQHHRRRDGRPSRPGGAQRLEPPDAVVEFVASLARSGRRLHAEPTCAAPAATGCSIASRRTERRPAMKCSGRAKSPAVRLGWRSAGLWTGPT